MNMEKDRPGGAGAREAARRLGRRAVTWLEGPRLSAPLSEYGQAASGCHEDSGEDPSCHAGYKYVLTHTHKKNPKRNTAQIH